jgi:phenylacetic acid degradation operon negative regulatory protein
VSANQIDPGSLAPVLGLRQDGDLGTSSASDLLITIFGELMRPAGGSAWTQTLIAALGLVGVEDKAARQAVSRLSAKGWIVSERVGRKSRWKLTDWATDLLTRGAERIYGLGATDREWDGEWLVLLASVPEAQRDLRSRLATQLGWAGFGTLGQGVWVSPRAERELEATSILRDLEVGGAVLFRSTMTDIGDPLDVADRAWPPAALAREYKTFLARPNHPSDSDTSVAARRLIELVDAWRRFPLADPDLPRELRPANWPGDRAASTFASQRSAWAPNAADWWATVERRFE